MKTMHLRLAVLLEDVLDALAGALDDALVEVDERLPQLIRQPPAGG